MEYYSAIKKNEIMLFAGKWMELEIILLRKVSQVQNNTILFHVLNLDLKICRDICMYTHIYKCMTVIKGPSEGAGGRGREKENDWRTMPKYIVSVYESGTKQFIENC
jgi:hypothetical protein